MKTFLRAFFAALLDALRDWQRGLERDALIRANTRIEDELEELQHDQDKADRITRAVDAVRGAGGVQPDRAAPPATDVRGYRD